MILLSIIYGDLPDIVCFRAILFLDIEEFIIWATQEPLVRELVILVNVVHFSDVDASIFLGHINVFVSLE